MSGGYIRRYIPTCETYGWTGGPGFSTRIVTRLNGRSRRNADWDQPVHSFTLPFQGLTQERYAPIKRMHLNRQGALGDQDLGSFLRLHHGCGCGYRRGCPGKHAACGERRADRDDQRPDQQSQLLPVHCRLPPCARQVPGPLCATRAVSTRTDSPGIPFAAAL